MLSLSIILKEKSITKKNKILLTIAISIAWIYRASAQCAMCGASNESAIKEGTGEGFKNINAGIMFLMVMPYIAFIVLVYMWYKHSYRNNQKRNSIDELLTQAKPTER